MKRRPPSDELTQRPRGELENATARIAAQLAAVTPDAVALDGDPDADAAQVTVFAPPAAQAGTTVLVQAFTHLVERVAEATRLARQFDAGAEARGRTTLHVPVPRGSSLHFELRMPGLVVTDAAQRLIWHGRTESAGFEVGVPAGTSPGASFVGTVTVRCEGIPVGEVRFTMRVVSLGAALDRRMPVPVGDAMRFEQAFLSYATADRAKVLAHVQIIRALGMRFFQDVLNLDPGERWEQRLYEELDRSDVLLLFWSRAAKQSQWVRKEVGYALARQRDGDSRTPAIRPVFVEGPPVEPPWEELAALHWDDRLLHMPP